MTTNILKRIFALTGALLLLASVALAAEPVAPKYALGERTNKVIFEVLNVAEHPVYLLMRSDVNPMNDKAKEKTLIRQVFDGDRLDYDAQAKSGHQEMQYREQTSYIINHNEKSYLKIVSQPMKMRVGEQPGEDVTNEPQESKRYFEGGKVKIAGVEYDYEDEIVDGRKTRYYYTVDEFEWKYWLMDGVLFEIVEYGTAIQPEWFTIPADYTEMSIPGMPGGMGAY